MHLGGIGKMVINSPRRNRRVTVFASTNKGTALTNYKGILCNESYNKTYGNIKHTAVWQQYDWKC